MLLKNKKCPKCETLYDELLDECPHCHEKNEEHLDLKEKFNILWLPYLIEILLFVFGILLLNLLMIILVFPFAGIINANEIMGTAIVNFSSYAVTFISILLLCIRNINLFKRFFNKASPYLWGIVAFLVLFAGDYLLSIFGELIYPSTSANQATAESIVTYYPILSILILGIIGPIVEEMTYRVGLFSFCRRFSRVLAYVVAILVFALIHFDFLSTDMTAELINLPHYIWAGAVLAFIYEKKGPAASMTTHILNNVLSVSMIILLK